jgi:hypothetical protein
MKKANQVTPTKLLSDKIDSDDMDWDKLMFGDELVATRNNPLPQERHSSIGACFVAQALL